MESDDDALPRWDSTSNNFSNKDIQKGLRLTPEEVAALAESEALATAVEQVQQWKKRWKASQNLHLRSLSPADIPDPARDGPPEQWTDRQVRCNSDFCDETFLFGERYRDVFPPAVKTLRTTFCLAAVKTLRTTFCLAAEKAPQTTFCLAAEKAPQTTFCLASKTRCELC